MGGVGPPTHEQPAPPREGCPRQRASTHTEGGPRQERAGSGRGAGGDSRDGEAGLDRPRGGASAGVGWEAPAPPGLCEDLGSHSVGRGCVEQRGSMI